MTTPADAPPTPWDPGLLEVYRSDYPGIRGSLSEADARALAASLQASAGGDPSDTVPRARLELSPAFMPGPCSDSPGEHPSVEDGAQVCYRLGDAFPGNDLLADASVSPSVQVVSDGGETDSTYSVTLTFTADGLREALLRQDRHVAHGADGHRGGRAVLSAPAITTAELPREIEVSGDFTQVEALELDESLQP